LAPVHPAHNKARKARENDDKAAYLTAFILKNSYRRDRPGKSEKVDHQGFVIQKNKWTGES
jgi:hypothetical protein